MYDARIGRWTSKDPYGQFSSPYLGMGNNPVSAIDSDGGYIYILGNGRNLMQRLFTGSNNTTLGKAMIDKYINNPHEHIYVKFGDVNSKTERQGLHKTFYSANEFTNYLGAKQFTMPFDPTDLASTDLCQFDCTDIPNINDPSFIIPLNSIL
jgi:uncharacterized protein RhaS with RHS repeats